MGVFLGGAYHIIIRVTPTLAIAEGSGHSWIKLEFPNAKHVFTAVLHTIFKLEFEYD